MRRYKAFVAEGISRGRRPELVGGGLIRSLGGWSQVLSLRRKGLRMAADDRVLGDGDFAEQIWSESTELDRETLRRKGPGKDLETLARDLIVDPGSTKRSSAPGVENGRFLKHEGRFVEPLWASSGIPRCPWPGSSG